MGGEGSGRKPDVLKQVAEQKQAVVNTSAESIYLPNYSGIKSGLTKTSTATPTFQNLTITNTTTTDSLDAYSISTDFIGANQATEISVESVLTSTNVFELAIITNQDVTATLEIDTLNYGNADMNIYSGGYLYLYSGGSDLTLDSDVDVLITCSGVNSDNVTIDVSNCATGLILTGLPTTSAGLPSGAVWVDTTGGLNILKVV